MKILELLDRHKMKAAFFVSGVNARKHPGLILEIVRRGHEIGNHSMGHDPFLMLKSAKTIDREVHQARLVLRASGIEALAFRPPVGIINPKLPRFLSAGGLSVLRSAGGHATPATGVSKTFPGGFSKRSEGTTLFCCMIRLCAKGRIRCNCGGSSKKFSSACRRLV